MEWWLWGVGEEGTWSYGLTGTEFLVYKLEMDLKVDDGDGCTTLFMYLITLNCTVKNVKMVHFMLCVFYHNLKIEKNILYIQTGKDLQDWLLRKKTMCWKVL